MSIFNRNFKQPHGQVSFLKRFTLIVFTTFSIGVLALAIPIGAVASGVPANATICDTPEVPGGNSLPPGPYENVVVKPGADCILLSDSGVHIEGNFYSDGANLVQLEGVTIDGNATITHTAFKVRLRSTTIGGNLTANDNKLPTNQNVSLGGANAGGGVNVGGNVIANNNDGFELQIVGNPIKGNVTAKYNTPDELDIGCGDIEGNLTVQENEIGGGAIFLLSDCRPFGTIYGVGTFGGNVTVKKNKAPYILLGPSAIEGNVKVSENVATEIVYETLKIGGNFFCKNNDPNPILAGIFDEMPLGPTTVGGINHCND